jgi:2-phosphoglycerate kinase
LVIGGNSGAGKSTLAYEFSKFYGVNVLEFDDIATAIKSITTAENFPIIHAGSENWQSASVEANKNWLINVSKTYATPLKAIIARHIEDNVPIIIEGDFICPEASLEFGQKVKTIFLLETDPEQLIKNFSSREGGEPQNFRAEISSAHANWIKNFCEKNKIDFLNARPWGKL